MTLTETFVVRLEELKAGDQARLRQLAGRPLDHTLDGFDLFTGLWWPLRRISQRRAPKRRSAWLVAKLYGAFPVPHIRAGPPARPSALPSVLGRAEPREEHGRTRFRQRFDALLLSPLAGLERHLRGAEALPRLGIYEDAIVRLEKALRLSPNNQKAQQMLLEIYMKTGNYAGAIPLCVRMLDQDSTRWDIKVDLLKALQGVEETAMCVFLSDQMLLQQPGDAGVLEISAYAHAAEGDTENALRMYEQVLANDPKHLLALEGSGVIYQWQKKWLKAVPYYLELLELDPKPEHYLALARGYAQQAEAGKTVIFLGQAANLYGAETVSPWLALPEFDPVRETADFRSFVDRMVGTGTRNAIEEIRRLEAQRTPLLEVDQIMLPSKPDLEILKPRR